MTAPQPAQNPQDPTVEDSDQRSTGQSGLFDFDRETALEPVAAGRWATMVHRHWNINESPNGGYALSPLLRAMIAELGGHRDPLTMTTHFLRPAMADVVAELQVEIVRRGRRTSTVRGAMVQEGKRRLEAICTLGELSSSPGEDRPDRGRSLSIEPPDLPPPDRCVDRLHLTQGVGLPLLSRVEVRVDPGRATPPAAGETPADGAGPATISGWMRFADGRPVDTAALVLFADCFPPSVFNRYGPIGRVPTIELTVHVRRRPVDGWIRACFTTSEMAGDLVIEDGLLWDESDRVVAQSRQLALLATA